MSAPVTVAFVVCIERGALEQQVLLLCRSLRRFGGVHREAPIHAFRPRRGRDVGAKTRKALDELGVVRHAEVLNTEFEHCAYANKIFASARAEELLSEDVLVFLDSDTVFTGEPLELALPASVAAAALPVSNARLASTGPGCANEAYWRRLYDLCGVRADAFVETVIDRRRIRPYFNSGLVAVRRAEGLFSRWRSNFVRLVDADHVSPLTGLTGMDEFSLAATLATVTPRMRILDVRYNYPLELVMRPQVPPPMNAAQLDELVHVHYRFWFNRPGYLSMLRPPVDPESPVVRWLNDRLPLPPIVDDAWIEHRRRTPGLTIHQVAFS